MKALAFPILLELSGEDCLDILRIGCENESPTSHGRLGGARLRWGMSQEMVPKFGIFMVQTVPEGLPRGIDPLTPPMNTLSTTSPRTGLTEGQPSRHHDPPSPKLLDPPFLPDGHQTAVHRHSHYEKAGQNPFGKELFNHHENARDHDKRSEAGIFGSSRHGVSPA